MGSQKTVLVTGGNGGIGAACVQRMREEGDYRVAVLDIDLAADVCVDISDVEATAAAIGDFGPVDVLIHCAAVIGPNGPLWEVSPDDWDRTMAINLRGTYSVYKAVIPEMISNGWGRIVTIASASGKEGSPMLSTYSASKAGVIGLIKSLGRELATTGVLVNGIAPTVIESPMTAATDPSVVKDLIAKIPMARLGRPEEVAELAAWLSSDRCTFSTGAIYDVSGGRLSY